MLNPAFGKILMIIGILISAFADPHGLGRSPGLGWRQTLGVDVGALIFAGGIYLRRWVKPSS